MLHKLLGKLVEKIRAPNQIIGDDYLCRWYLLPKNRIFNIYLHKFGRSDDDRALHDHPWPSLSICIKGCMREYYYDTYWLRRSRYIILEEEKRHISAGQIIYRPAAFAHRLELYDKEPVWTIFITGATIRQWGFFCPKGWRHWKEFTSYNTTGDSSYIGKGCD